LRSFILCSSSMESQSIYVLIMAQSLSLVTYKLG